MSTNATIEPPRIYAAFRCRDAEEMIRFLKEAFGFTEHVVYRREGIVEHAQLAFGSAMVMLGQDRDDEWGKIVGRPGAPNGRGIYVAIPNADALHARVKAAGARIVMDLTDQPYGSRDFACLDPEGNVWTFGTYWPKAHEKALPG
ncbi:MAG TPA: VOC family protein [Paracoccaceae bacterium]|nr:VOC family protein [Paracoccaceae bacterium]